VFLFDEPLSNLDAKLRVPCAAEIKPCISGLKTTTIYVTHDQVEAMTMADRIVVLRDGRIEQIGSRSSSTTTRRTCSWPSSSARPP
jgi:multiple sugar transport system ATP-binding protein